MRTGAGDSRQRLARHNVTEYAARSGLRRTAKRLVATVSDVRRWLESGFPKEKLDAAIALGKPGGAYVYVRQTRWSKLVGEIGARRAAALTGIPEREVKKLARSDQAVRFDREALKKAIKKRGKEEVAKTLAVKPSIIEIARHRPLTESTKRLRRFVRQYGQEAVATFVGVHPSTLGKWIRDNIPKSWEADINRKIGTYPEGTPEQKEVGRKKPNIAKEIERAREAAKAWNKKVPERFRIRLRDAVRWARLGTFDSYLQVARDALTASKKPTPRRKKKLPPIRPKLPKPGEALDQAINSFKQARAEAFFEGRYPTPPAPWGRTRRWKLTRRQGIHVFKKVQKFVYQVDFDVLEQEMTALAKKIWRMLHGKGEMMTIRLTFSAMGSGHPFYPDAFLPGDKVNFFNRNAERITSEEEIVRTVRDLMKEVSSIDSEVIMLFFEHYEIVKSIDIEEAK